MTRDDRFVHLHVHSDYSFQDGLCVIPQLVRRVRDLGQPAVALTDHGNLHGLIDFLNWCEELGVQGIPGCEVYLAPGHRSEKPHMVNGEKEPNYYHLTLLARDMTGYRNLVLLSSRAFLEGFYYRPRVDKELLREHAAGLICLSGCLQGELAQVILASEGRDLEPALRVVEEYRNLFGPEAYYLEFQYHGLPEDRVLNTALLEIARRLDIPLVATNDAHYLRREDADVHKIRVRISTNTPEPQPVPLGFPVPEFYLKSRDEMAAALDRMSSEAGVAITAQEIDDMLDRTLEIARKVNIRLPEKQYKLPEFPVPHGESLESYFAKEVRRRFEEVRLPLLQEKARAGQLRHSLDAYRDRLEHEIKTIQAMGFAGYFLVVADFINWAKRQGIPVGPGRGSAAGSLVAYALGITEIDPLQYDLLFERFLNPERITMPDIDVDFCAQRRDQVIEYVRDKYGQESVAQIITFQTLAARGAIRDVARVLRVNPAEIDRIANMVPLGPGVSLKKLVKNDAEIRQLLEHRDETIRKVFHYALRLEGVVKNSGTHAAGIVIAPGKLTDFVAVCRSKEGETQTQFEMNALERLGLLKVDFLGLINLTIIDDCLRRIREKTGEEIDVQNIPLDDPEVFRLFCEGKTDGVFQFESSGMKDLLRRFKPQRFEDLIALNALYRPGPMQMLDDFIERRHGLRQIRYELPELEPILSETYGIIVYQEQVMQIAAQVAGFSMAEADNLRRAMAKKKKKEMDVLRPRFIDGAVQRGIPRDKAERLFQTMEKFAEYGFNKSHSTAYALIAYQTAYLKAHYPVYYMAALLSNRMHHQEDLAKYIRATRELGIEVLPPDINESDEDFTVIDDRHIRFGLAGIKGVGPAVVHAILEARQRQGRFASLFHFVSSVDHRAVNRKALEALVKAGAFDSMGYTRRAHMEALDPILERVGRTGPAGRGPGWMLSMKSLPGLLQASEEHLRFDMQAREEWDERLKLSYEKETLGVYLTAHPCERYEPELKQYRRHAVADLDDRYHNQNVRLAGMITRLAQKKSRRGARYAVAQFEDLTGAVEVFVPPQVLDASREAVMEEVPVILQGLLEADEGRTRVLAREIWTLQEARNQFARTVEIQIRVVGAPPELPNALRDLLEKYPGTTEVLLVLRKPGRFTATVEVPQRVQLTHDLLEALQELVGPGRIRILGESTREGALLQASS